MLLSTGEAERLSRRPVYDRTDMVWLLIITASTQPRKIVGNIEPVNSFAMTLMDGGNVNVRTI